MTPRSAVDEDRLGEDQVDRTRPRPNPIALRTATSVVRSRRAIAIAFPATKIEGEDDRRPDVAHHPPEVAVHLGEHLG